MGEFSRIYKRDLTDRQFASLWEVVMASGRDRAVMFGMPPMDGVAFTKWVRGEGVPTWAVMFRGTPCGLFFLENRRGKTADAHFCVFPMGTERMASPIGRIPVALGYGFFCAGAALWEKNASDGFVLDTLVGIIPSCNRKALKYVDRLGVRFHASVPGMCWCYDTGDNVPGIVMTLSRTEFPEWTAAL